MAAQWDRVVEHPNNPHQFYYREADLLISRALSNGMQVLELGCGTGGSSEIHMGEVRTLVVTDSSRGMLLKARRRLARSRRGARIHFSRCEAQRLPFRSASFDAVISRGVMLSYVEDPRRALSEMVRVLRSEGVVAFDVMNALEPRSKDTGGSYGFFGRTPCYFEVRRIGDRQVRRIFSSQEPRSS